MPTPHNKLPKHVVDTILREYPSRTAKDIAADLGICQNTVMNYARLHGIRKERKIPGKGAYRFGTGKHANLHAHRITLCQYFGIDPLHLPRDIVVHHKNGNKEDDRLSNLCFMTNADHMALHSGGTVDLVATEERALASIEGIENILDMSITLD